MIKHSKYFVIFYILLVCSCSNVINDRKATKTIYMEVMDKNYQEALEIVNNDDFYSKDTSKLLKFLELGTINYLNNNYYQALKNFEEAKKISDELYTISISKKTLSMWDANLDNYYGEVYEASLIRFYISLINYNLYQQGFYEEYKDENGNIIPKKDLTEKEKIFHLNYAKTSIIEWESFLKNIQNSNYGETTYKNDILAKLWGAFIYEQFNFKNDDNIALILYDNASDILLKNYNMYSIYNEKSDEFKKDYKKLPTLSYQELYKNYIKDTKYSKDLQNYIKRNKKNLEKQQKDNLVVLIKDNLIAPKKAKVLEMPLPVTSLGLSFNDTYEMASVMTTINGVPYILIEFPEIEINKEPNKYTVNVYDMQDKYIATVDLTLIEPLSYIAQQELNNNLLSIQSKIISRIVAKYLAALSSSYALYNKEDNLSKITALLSFKASSEIINKTSMADLRYWITLASYIQMGGIKLNNGQYKIEIISNDKEKVYDKIIEIDNNTKFIDLNI